ncbi:hypothetical protein [Streptomyces sp. RK9]|uniref:hypothetical protein n=1 Tax=Streptomyces sp. RK9 TaxID=3239284 RepID=UPI0038650C82
MFSILLVPYIYARHRRTAEPYETIYQARMTGTTSLRPLMSGSTLVVTTTVDHVDTP